MVNEEVQQRALLDPEYTMNPAVAFLINRGLVQAGSSINSGPWLSHGLRKTDDTRRFVRSRSTYRMARLPWMDSQLRITFSGCATCITLPMRSMRRTPSFVLHGTATNPVAIASVFQSRVA